MEIDNRLLPCMNIGMIGHVDHGKTTLTEALTGTWTDKHSEEIKRGISIRIGYADMTIYKCSVCNVYSTTEKCMKCFNDCEPVYTVSFVDLPGHETLIATVLSGTALMDYAILVISATEKCPQQQTAEHLVATKIGGVKNIIVAQNKIDLVSKERAMESYKEIKRFLEEMDIDAPIIPVSAQKRININFLLDAIVENFKIIKREDTEKPLLLIARSFDVNKPGTDVEKINGGVIGGALMKGKLNVGDTIEIKPGIVIEGKYEPIKTKIVGIQKKGRNLKTIEPGGLSGVMTELDPFLTKSDRLAGNIASYPSVLPETTNTLDTEFIPFSTGNIGYNRDIVNKGDIVMVTSYTIRSVGNIIQKSGDNIRIVLKIPLCKFKGGKIAISKQINGRWRLVGYGIIK